MLGCTDAELVEAARKGDVSSSGANCIAGTMRSGGGGALRVGAIT